MNKPIFLFFVLAVFSSLALAQPLDTAIIATDIASVDLLVARAAGEKAGLPVLVAENGLVTQAIIDELKKLDIKTIILVGGPVVVKEEAEASLKANFEVIRLWGFERTGTAIEVAKFFWPAGANCIALSDDTKSVADTDLHLRASQIASLRGCPLVPVPKGELPAEVLDLISKLNASIANYFGSDISPNLRAKLAKLVLREMVGDIKKISKDVDDEIEAETKAERKKLKLVIVAAPSWRESLALGAQPSENSVVRQISDVSQVPELVSTIKAKNISDVRVVGSPALAQQIADELRSANITVKKVSGEKASEVAKELFKEMRFRWQEKHGKAELEKVKVKITARAKLLEKVNETSAELDEELVEIEGLSAEGAPNIVVSNIKEKISGAKARLGELRRLAEAGDVDGALRLEIRLRNDIAELKWKFRQELRLKVSEKLEEEERGIENAAEQIKIEELESRLAGLRQKCNATAIETLLQKSKALREDIKAAISEGNHTKAAHLLVEARKVFNAARHLEKVCEKRGKIEEKLEKISRERAEKAEELKEKIAERLQKIEEKIAEKFEVKFDVPSSATAGEKVEISWKVESAVPLRIAHTAVHYDYASHPGELGLDVGPAKSGYPSLTGEFAKGNFTIPGTFKALITPDKSGTLYLRAHAIINGKNYWTDEKIIIVKAKEQMQAAQTAVSYSIEADDTAFYINNEKTSSISVKKGDGVKITFKVREDGVYFGGLAFKSSTVSTGDMKKGESKSVEFTADSSFTITSYWPASNQRKADLQVKVE